MKPKVDTHGTDINDLKNNVNGLDMSLKIVKAKADSTATDVTALTASVDIEK